MYDIKCISILPVMGEPLAINSVMGEDGKSGFIARFDKPGDEPDTVTMLPDEDSPGGWPSVARFEGETYYLGASISVDDLSRKDIQAKFLQMLRESFL
jgi:hypothetical protein